MLSNLPVQLVLSSEKYRTELVEQSNDNGEQHLHTTHRDRPGRTLRPNPPAASIAFSVDDCRCGTPRREGEFGVKRTGEGVSGGARGQGWDNF